MVVAYNYFVFQLEYAWKQVDNNEIFILFYSKHEIVIQKLVETMQEVNKDLTTFFFSKIFKSKQNKIQQKNVTKNN